MVTTLLSNVKISSKVFVCTEVRFVKQAECCTAQLKLYPHSLNYGHSLAVLRATRYLSSLLLQHMTKQLVNKLCLNIFTLLSDDIYVNSVFKVIVC